MHIKKAKLAECYAYSAMPSSVLNIFQRQLAKGFCFVYVYPVN